ncbi:MAG: 6-pyruvoyl tetrahydropterin synthase family protein [Planctomycetota bacterium]
MSRRSSTDKSYAIRLEKEALTFCAAHFITYGDNVCEPLHGHNYGVAVEAEGPLEKNAYVLDFIAVRDALVAITRGLDHKMLLATEHPTIGVEQASGPLGGNEVVATFENRRWVFPAEECVLLPIANTTAESLATWVGERLLERLSEQGHPAPERLTVSVDECQGQLGICRFG